MAALLESGWPGSAIRERVLTRSVSRETPLVVVLAVGGAVRATPQLLRGVMAHPAMRMCTRGGGEGPTSVIPRDALWVPRSSRLELQCGSLASSPGGPALCSMPASRSTRVSRATVLSATRHGTDRGTKRVRERMLISGFTVLPHDGNDGAEFHGQLFVRA